MSNRPSASHLSRAQRRGRRPARGRNAMARRNSGQACRRAAAAASAQRHNAVPGVWLDPSLASDEKWPRVNPMHSGCRNVSCASQSSGRYIPATRTQTNKQTNKQTANQPLFSPRAEDHPDGLVRPRTRTRSEGAGTREGGRGWRVDHSCAAARWECRALCCGTRRSAHPAAAVALLPGYSSARHAGTRRNETTAEGMWSHPSSCLPSPT